LGGKKYMNSRDVKKCLDDVYQEEAPLPRRKEDMDDL
jgi:hypothetical protein